VEPVPPTQLAALVKLLLTELLLQVRGETFVCPVTCPPASTSRSINRDRKRPAGIRSFMSGAAVARKR